MSRKNGPSSALGTAIEIGFVPSRASAPPNGATCLGERPESAVHSPIIQKIEVVTRGDVRRAKLYYLRDLRGKKAKIKEKRDTVAR